MIYNYYPHFNKSIKALFITLQLLLSFLPLSPEAEIAATDFLELVSEFLRYDGRAAIVKDAALLEKVRAALTKIMDLYDKNGWEMGLFYLEEGHAEIRGMMDLKEEVDV